MSIWDTLRSIINARFSIIQKGKKYVKRGQTPPKGVQLHKGPNGGIYYFVEDKHVKQGGQHHELIRSRGVTQDQFKEIEEKFKAQGAVSVHFVHKPNLEKNEAGKNLYNIYVNYGDKTQKKIADKQAADKAKYAARNKWIPTTDIEKPEFTEKDGIHSAPAYDYVKGKYVENGRYEIHPSGSHGAKLYHIDKNGTRNKVTYSYDKVWGDQSAEDIDHEKSRVKNIGNLKDLVGDLYRSSGPRRRNFLIQQMQDRDQKKAEEVAAGKKPKPLAKNPLWDIHTTLRELIDAGKSQKKTLDIPEFKPDPNVFLRSMLDARMNQPGKVEEIENEETAMQHKRGDTPVKDFLSGHLKKHFPDAPDEMIQDAARSGTSFHGNGRQRLSDSYRYAMHKLTRLMKQPVKPEGPKLPPVQAKKVEKEPVKEPEQNAGEWTETTYKDPRVAGAAMAAMQSAGHEAEILQNEWQADKGHIIRVRYRKKPQGPVEKKPVEKPSPEPEKAPVEKEPVQKKEKPFVTKYQTTTPEAAQKRKEELEAKGREVRIVEKKHGKHTVYDVQHRAKDKPADGPKTARVSLPAHNTWRTWMRRIDGHVKGATHENIGELLQPTESSDGQRHFDVPDGLYHGATGSKNSDTHKMYHVKDGKAMVVPEGEHAMFIKRYTPEIPREQFEKHLEESKKKQSEKLQTVTDAGEAQKIKRAPINRFYVGNTSPQMADVLKQKYKGRWNPESKHWWIDTQMTHKELEDSLNEDFGGKVATRDEREWFNQLGHPQQIRESIGRISNTIREAYKKAGRPLEANRAIDEGKRMFNDAEENIRRAGQKGAKAFVQNPYLHDRWHRADQIIKQVLDKLH